MTQRDIAEDLSFSGILSHLMQNTRVMYGTWSSLTVFTIAPLDAGLRQFGLVAVSLKLAWSILILSQHMAYPWQFDVLRQNSVHFVIYPKWTSNGNTAFLWHVKTCGLICMYLSTNRHGVTFFIFVSVRTINLIYRCSVLSVLSADWLTFSSGPCWPWPWHCNY
jgi:hypothetical protein